MGLFLVNNMKYPHSSPSPSPILKNGQIEFLVLKVVQCSETDEKSIFFRFLVFEIWSVKILRVIWIFFCFRRCIMYWNGSTLTLKFSQYLVFGAPPLKSPSWWAVGGRGGFPTFHLVHWCLEVIYRKQVSKVQCILFYSCICSPRLEKN